MDGRGARGRRAGLALAAAVVLALAGCTSAVTGEPVAVPRNFTPSADNHDPSVDIPDVVFKTYLSGLHVRPTERVAYDRSPPFGGTHDATWAACDGVVYERAVRTENMVHSLEHGAVWIAYNPDRLDANGVATLAKKVRDQQYMMLSPYPGLDKPISLQSWGHQLKVDDVGDARIDQFVQALRRNRYAYPEIGATCRALGAPMFDRDNPPAFDPSVPQLGQPNVRPPE